jgi:hypothetical protein
MFHGNWGEAIITDFGVNPKKAMVKEKGETVRGHDSSVVS